MIPFSRKLVGFSVALLAGIALAKAETNTGNLRPILNAYVAAVAKNHPEYKAEIRPWRDGVEVPPGYQAGSSTQMGTYIFRPKSFEELSQAQKDEILSPSNEKLKAFIISMRNARVYPAISAANQDQLDAAPTEMFPVEGAKQVNTEYRVRVTPEEMVRNRPVEIEVLPTPVK